MRVLVAVCFVLGLATATLSATTNRRISRDVSELSAPSNPSYNYLPPDAAKQAPADSEVVEAAGVATESLADAGVVPAVETVPGTAELGSNGYEYRTVRRLRYRYRQRRDVSHLANKYLPPPQATTLSNEYLPPTPTARQADVDTPAVEEVAAPTNEYLPPSNAGAETEAPSAIPVTEEVPAVNDVMEPEEEEAPQDTAVLLKDGYHYKQPSPDTQMLFVMPEPRNTNTNTYLPPPLDSEVVEAVGPEESAVLADDGYHYRTIRRYRF